MRGGYEKEQGDEIVGMRGGYKETGGMKEGGVIYLCELYPVC